MHKMGLNIAFAYAAVSKGMHMLYSSVAEGMTENLREKFPHLPILMVTDDATPPIKGVHKIFRVDRNVPLMTWRMKVHQMAHQMAEEILFLEPDVRIVDANLMEVFDKKDFDVAITGREIDVMWEGEMISKTCPYTLGATFSRSAEFWRECKLACQKLDAKDQEWIGDMKALAEVVNSGNFKVKVLDGSVYNHVPNDPHEAQTAKVLHYKGKRKDWLLPRATEAAA